MVEATYNNTVDALHALVVEATCKSTAGDQSALAVTTVTCIHMAGDCSSDSDVGVAAVKNKYKVSRLLH